MKRLSIAVTLTTVLLLSACISAPMSPTAYRESAMKGEGFSTVESFEVNRSIAKVTRTFKKKAPECLSYSIGENRRPLIGIGSTTHVYGWTKPTVKVSSKKTELYFQVKYENMAAKVPKDGMYYLVADAYPLGKNKTHLDIYRRTSVSTLGQAIRGWASGKNLGCPDPNSFL